MVRGWIVLLVLFSNPFCDFLLFLFPNFDDEGRKSEGGEARRRGHDIGGNHEVDELLALVLLACCAELCFRLQSR